MPVTAIALPQLVATMLYLDSENKKDLNLYINCSGGEVRSRMHLCGMKCTCAVVGKCRTGAWWRSALGNDQPSCLFPCKHVPPAGDLRCHRISKPPVRLFVCCPMQVVPCLAIHDTMKHIKSDVGTVGFGGCMGMSGFLLAVGKKVGSPAFFPCNCYDFQSGLSVAARALRVLHPAPQRGQLACKCPRSC